MKRNITLLGILFLVFLMVGCKSGNLKEQHTTYNVIENGKKTYFENYEFTKDIPSFDSILKSTIKSLNEIKDGKRDLTFVRSIESEELKSDPDYKVFSKSIPGDSELKIKKADITNYNITGVEHNKDENLIKVFIEIETKEVQDDSVINVLNNQTYIFKVEKDMLLLTKFHLSQHLQ
ncbi:hypothetical protein [Clostridium sp.]|uniref:hypothetical protein n=1 Tax=Clostridium sp. TaxID=1506 RepID=UPI002FC91F79